jgi:hypothetical protein
MVVRPATLALARLGSFASPGGLLREFLHAYLPSDAHERCRGNTHVGLTRLFPVVRSEVRRQENESRRTHAGGGGLSPVRHPRPVICG